MSKNDKHNDLPGVDSTAIVSEIRIQVRVDEKLNMLFAGAAISDIDVARILGTAQAVALSRIASQSDESKIVVPQVQVGPIPPEMRS